MELGRRQGVAAGATAAGSMVTGGTVGRQAVARDFLRWVGSLRRSEQPLLLDELVADFEKWLRKFAVRLSWRGHQDASARFTLSVRPRPGRRPGSGTYGPTRLEHFVAAEAEAHEALKARGVSDTNENVAAELAIDPRYLYKLKALAKASRMS